MSLPEKMANKFQRREQVIKLLEELGECSAAIARYLNGSTAYNMIDEIIDVEFLFAQMRCYFYGFEAAKERNDAEIKNRFFK